MNKNENEQLKLAKQAADYYIEHYDGKYVMLMTTCTSDRRHKTKHVTFMQLKFDRDELLGVLTSDGLYSICNLDDKAVGKTYDAFLDSIKLDNPQCRSYFGKGTCCEYFPLKDFYNPYVKESFFKFYDKPGFLPTKEEVTKHAMIFPSKKEYDEMIDKMERINKEKQELISKGILGRLNIPDDEMNDWRNE